MKAILAFLYQMLKRASQLLLAALVLILVLMVLIQIPWIQNKLVSIASKSLSEKLGTEVKVDRVHINWLTKLELQGLLIRDLDQDTMIYVGSMRNDYSIFDQRAFYFDAKKISLDHVLIHLKNTEKDSTLNLIKLFRSNNPKVDTNTNKQDKTSPKSNGVANFQIQELDLRNFKIIFDRNYKQEKLEGRAEHLSIKSDALIITDSILNIKYLGIEKPMFWFHSFPSKWPPKNKDLVQYLSIPIKLDIDSININQGIVKFEDENSNSIPDKHHVGFSSLEISKIDIKVGNVKIRKHYFTGQVHNLSAVDKSGLNIKRMSTNLFFSTYQMRAKNLDFETEKSRLRGYLQFDYRHMNEFLRFAKKVKITSSLSNSRFDLDDLAYFIDPRAPFVHNVINFSGDFRGNLNDFHIKNLRGDINKQIPIDADIDIQNMFPISDIHIKASIRKLIANESSVEYFYKGFDAPKGTQTLGNISYSGEYSGNFKIFELKGRANTALGAVIFSPTRFDFTTPNKTKYKGTFNTEKFDLAKLINSNVPYGAMTATIVVDGNGFDFNSLETRAKGQIHSISYNQNIYHNIGFEGDISQKVFRGSLSSPDPNLDMTAKGLFSLLESKPEIQMNLKANSINLKKLGLTDRNLTLKSNAEMFFEGKKIDDFKGSILLRNNTIIEENGVRKYIHNFSDVTLNSYFLSNRYRKITINSKEIVGSIQGVFLPSELPRLIKNYLVNYLDLSNKEDRVYTFKKDTSFFDLDLNLDHIDQLVRVFWSDLKSIEGGRLKGRYYGELQELDIDGDFSNIQFRGFMVNNLKIFNKASLQSFNTNITIDSVYLDGKIVANPISLSIKDIKSGLQVGLNVMNENHPKHVNFQSEITKLNQQYLIHILPFVQSSKGPYWYVDPENQILVDFERKNLDIKHLNLSKADQSLNIMTHNANGLNKLRIDLRDIVMREILSGILPEWDKVNGLINGKIELINPLDDKPQPILDVNISDLAISKYNLGKLNVKSDIINGKLTSEINLRGSYANIVVNGNYDLESPDRNINYNINAEKINPEVLNEFFPSLIYDLTGNLKANLKLTGTQAEPNLSGILHIDTLYTKVNNIHTGFSITNHQIVLTPTHIELGQMTLRDELNNTGSVWGSISHEHLKNFRLNIKAKSPEFLVLNTNSKQNSSFFGKAIVKIDNAKFEGVIGERINIYAIGENMPESELNIVFNNDQKTSQFSFFEFIDKQKKTDTSYFKIKKNKNVAGVNLDFDFEVNEKGKLTIVFDPLIDDKVVIYGNGRIAFKMNPVVDMDIKGSYTFSRGTYLFTYQNFIQRIFYLEPGGQIQFLGDPYMSRINASATFKARASAQDLVYSFYGSESQDPNVISAAKSLVKAEVTLLMKNLLTKPDISYDIDIEQNNPTLQTAFEAIKANTRNNDNEMNRQVFALLALQRFLPPSVTGFENTNVGGSDLTNTALDVVSKKISSVFTEWLQTSIQGLNFDFNYRGYQQQYSSESDRRHDIKVALSKQLLNNRLRVNLGGNYDFGQNSLRNSNSAFFGGDIDLEYRITPSGNLRGKVYSTLDNDLLNSKYINKTGVSLNYGRDFDNLIDFLNLRRRRREKSDTLPDDK